jgi:hypothetical protein
MNPRGLRVMVFLHDREPAMARIIMHSVMHSVIANPSANC